MTNETSVPLSRPSLYLDGAALADRLAAWTVTHTDPAVRLKHRTWITGLPRLYDGLAFYPPSDPARKSLQRWLLAQHDQSVTPEAFYEQAITAAGGNVQKGMIVAWDVLREGWKDGDNRNDFPHIRKLVDITGERAVFRTSICSAKSDEKTARGDNFSAWYHMSGTALLVFSKATSGLASPSGAAWFARRMVDLEEHVFFGGYVDGRKRIALDLAGIELGERLAADLQRNVTGPLSNPARDYLYDNEKLYGPSWTLAPGQSPCSFREGTRPHSQSGVSLRQAK